MTRHSAPGRPCRDPGQPASGAGYQPTLLRVLITERHWQKFPTFERQFRKAAAALAGQQGEPELAKVAVSARQFERWYAGQVKTEPYPDACRVLEFMFGQPVKRLFAAAAGGLAPAPPCAGVGDIGQHRDLAVLAEKVRLQMAEALVAPARPDIGYLAEGVAQHAADCVATAPEQMLGRLIADYDQARLLLAERQPLGEQRNLYRIAAQLGALVADEFMVLGKAHHAAAWQEIAGRAADETEDSDLRAHVRTLAAILPLYYGDPAVTVRLTRQAQAIPAGPGHATRAMAPALEALACAQLGDRESSLRALEAARAAFDSIAPGQQAESVFGFSQRRWRFYESRTLSRLSDIPSAIAAEQRALDLYPPEVVGDRALLQLDLASCLVRSKEIQLGISLARDALLAMPAEHRTDIFLRYAWHPAAAVPARFRNQPHVTGYCDVLRSLSAARNLAAGHGTDR
jgi:tetratricopeptide (TPR) repeat protein